MAPHPVGDFAKDAVTAAVHNVVRAMDDKITTAFRRFLSGEISFSDMQSSLAEILAHEPSAAPELGRRLADLLAKGRLPLQLHDLLLQMVPPDHRLAQRPPTDTATRL